MPVQENRPTQVDNTLVSNSRLVSKFFARQDGLCGVVVKTPAQESADPGFESRLFIRKEKVSVCSINAFVIECE